MENALCYTICSRVNLLAKRVEWGRFCNPMRQEAAVPHRFCRIPSAFAGDQAAFPTTRQALWPPKPKLLVSTRLIVSGRAALGT